MKPRLLDLLAQANRALDAYLRRHFGPPPRGASEHECVFVEEQEPSGRLVLPPCIVCGLSALDALQRQRSPDAYLYRDPDGDELWLHPEDVELVWVAEEIPKGAA